MAELGLSAAEGLLATLFAPWVQDLGLSVEEIGPGRAVLRMRYDPKLTRIGGTVCGQALMALADTTMVFTVASGFGEFRPMTTVNQSTQFMRAISNADVLAEGRLLRLGRTMAFGEVRLRADGDDAPAVHVSSAYAILPEAAVKAAG